MHYRLLLKVENNKARSFYMKEDVVLNPINKSNVSYVSRLGICLKEMERIAFHN